MKHITAVLATVLLIAALPGCALFGGKTPVSVLTVGTVQEQAIGVASDGTQTTIDAWKRLAEKAQHKVHALEFRDQLVPLTSIDGTAPVADVLKLVAEKDAANSADDATLEADAEKDKTQLAIPLAIAKAGNQLLQAYNKTAGIDPNDYVALSASLNDLADKYKASQAARAAADAAKAPQFDIKTLANGIVQQMLGQIAAGKPITFPIPKK